jgi:predicted thioesterase
MTLEAGIERTETFIVEGRLLTDVRGTLPVPVLATPAMIAMIEHVEVRHGERTIGVGTHERRVVGRARFGPPPS